ncbi:MAG: hypothetical protein WBA41_03860 [Rivularia sp. (in: cyanobacteria)]
MTLQLFPKLALSFITILTYFALPLNSAVALQKSPTNLKINSLLSQTTTTLFPAEDYRLKNRRDKPSFMYDVVF